MEIEITIAGASFSGIMFFIFKLIFPQIYDKLKYKIDKYFWQYLRFYLYSNIFRREKVIKTRSALLKQLNIHYEGIGAKIKQNNEVNNILSELKCCNFTTYPGHPFHGKRRKLLDQLYETLRKKPYSISFSSYLNSSHKRHCLSPKELRLLEKIEYNKDNPAKDLKMFISKKLNLI